MHGLKHQRENSRAELSNLRHAVVLVFEKVGAGNETVRTPPVRN
jgi:hypothetical protein